MTEFLSTPSGDRVAFDARGEGPAVIFIAGAGPSGREEIWARTAEFAAAAGLTAITYDRLGRGESTTSGVLDLDRELEAIAALIDRAGGSAALFGHSSGAAIALAAAVRGLPVTALALCEAPLGGVGGGAAEWAAELGRRIDADDLEGALTHYMKDMPPEWLEAARARPDFGAMVAGVVSYKADAESLAWAESAPLPDLIGDLGVPVLALVGEQTLPVMVTASQAIVDAVPGADQRTVAGADHAWEPAALAAELVELVQGAHRAD